MAIPLTAAQFGLLYAGGSIVAEFAMAATTTVLHGCAEQYLSIASAHRSEWDTSIEACSNNQSPSTSTVSESSSIAGSVISTPCNMSFKSSTCSSMTNTARCRFKLFDADALGLKRGMYVFVDVVAGRGCTVDWNNVFLTSSDQKRVSTQFYASAPGNAASTWGSQGNFTLETSAGNIGIPVTDRSLVGASGAAGMSVTAQSLTWTSAPVFTFTPFPA